MVALGLIVFIPVNHQCFGVMATTTSPSGSTGCSWTTGLNSSQPWSLLVVAAAVAAILALQLLSTNARFLIAVGIATTLLWIATIAVVLPNYEISYWASVHGIEYGSGTGNLESEVLVMVPSGLLPLIAGIRRLRRQSREAAAAS